MTASSEEFARIGDSLELEVERLVAGGEGLARVGPDRLVVLVPDVAPGERCRVRVRARGPRWARADVEAILAPGPARRTPACPHQIACGGCPWMHLDVEVQRSAKEEIVLETLARAICRAALPPVRHLVGEALGYRLRARFAAEGGRLGYRAARSHAFVPVERCPILAPALEGVLRDPPELPRERCEVFAAVGEDGALAWTVRAEEVRGPRRVRKGRAARERIGVPAVGWTIAGRRLAFAPEEFFQANATLLRAFADAALGDARGTSAWEFHAGVGFFTAALAQRFGRVDAVEADDRHAARVQSNAPDPWPENVQWHASSAERWLASRGPAIPDFCLLDPPRHGARDLCLALAPRSIPRIHYVSCNPATLARDLVPFVERGYRVDDLLLVDQFPHTPHIELVAQLRRDAPRVNDPGRGTRRAP